MQFPESWLREFSNPSITTAELCHLLTMAGLEVEECRAVGGDFTAVVVAAVTAVEKHPNADKLKLCQVDCGPHGRLQIVCGAPNVAVGIKVPCALVGAKLPQFKIKQAKVRGIESQGMLCSAKELALAEDADGLLLLPQDAPLGEDLRKYLHLDEQLITIKLTPNRADCLSITGLARELTALSGAPLHLPEILPVAVSHPDSRHIVLDAAAACPRYCGRIVRGVNARAQTPAWLKQRIERCGVRSISPLVDVTNYVMLELGQPLHAFDNQGLQGDIHVRYAKAGEKLLLLNEQTVSLTPQTLVIADASKALAMAGVMGGEDSAVSDSTTELFLESAFFSPQAIAGKARELGFASDASFRFERGVDFDLPRQALERATALILEICGGEAGPVTEAVDSEHLPRRETVTLRMQRVAPALGVELSSDQIETLINSLGFSYQRQAELLKVTPPSYRFDIAIEADLIEEIARLYGYDNIPAAPPQALMQMSAHQETRRDAMQVRHLLAERGFIEVVNYSFVDAAWEEDFVANTEPLRLANPIASQMAVMRSSLMGGLINSMAVNLKRQSERLRIFEIGRCFSEDETQDTGYLQPLRLAALIAGTQLPEQWGVAPRDCDFYDLKGDLEALFAPRVLDFERVSHPALHPGRSARVLLEGREIGVIGELHPNWQQKYELSLAAMLFEIDLVPLLDQPLPKNQELSRFPAVVRDIALQLPRQCEVGRLHQAMLAAAPNCVTKLVLFDVYQGSSVSSDSKSLAFRIVMQDTEKTLADNDADATVARLLEVAAEQFGASLRK